MSDLIPKPSTQKIGGLGPKAQKLQALREKAAAAAQASGSAGKPNANAAATKLKASNSFAGKKTSFQRKAV